MGIGSLTAPRTGHGDGPIHKPRQALLEAALCDTRPGGLQQRDDFASQAPVIGKTPA